MFEAKLTIEAPGLTNAINRLADALSYRKEAGSAVQANPAPAVSSAPVVNAPSPAFTVQQPAPIPTVQQPAPPVPTAPVNYPAPGVPLAPPPQYTVDQIMAAGGALMDAGKIQELSNLLHSFGVQTVTDLKPEQLGAFATAMRELGAKI